MNTIKKNIKVNDASFLPEYSSENIGPALRVFVIFFAYRDTGTNCSSRMRICAHQSPGNVFVIEMRFCNTGVAIV